MVKWKEYIADSDLIFLRQPNNNKGVWFFDPQLLDKSDVRIRKIPLTTNRPNFVELKRIQWILSTVDIFPPTLAAKTSPRKSAEEEIAIEHKLEEQFERAEDVEAKGGERSVSEPLLSAEQREQREKFNCLCEAIKSGQVERVKELLRKGSTATSNSSISETAHEVTSPLYLAVEQNDQEVVEFLLHFSQEDHSFDPQIDLLIPSKRFSTALHKASQNGNLELVELLLESGGWNFPPCV